MGGVGKISIDYRGFAQSACHQKGIIMNGLAEISQAITASNESLEVFKARMEARFEQYEIADAKAHRPNLSGERSDAKFLTDPECKAFNSYLKSGDKHELKSLAVGTNGGADGGYAVPKAIDAMIEAILVKQSPIRRYANVVQIQTPDYHKLVNTRGWGSSWVGELAARPATGTAALVDIVPPMGELYANPQASQQMLDDVFFNAGQWIADEIGITFGAAESDAFLNGSGANQPKGLLTYPTAATADGTRAFGTFQYIPTGAAAAFATTNPLDVFQQAVFSMRPGYRDGAVWLMNPSTMSTVSQFKDSYGRYLLQPSPVLGQPATILGYAVVECEHMPAVAANALAVVFANLQRAYLIADRVGTRVLVDPYSSKPNVGYYCTKRLGGAMINSECVKAIKIAAS